MVKMSAWKTKGWKARRSEVGGQRSETIQQNPEAEPVSITMALLGAYIVRLKVTQISDDSNPDKERRRPEQDAAQVIVCEVLRKEKKAPLRRAPRAPLTDEKNQVSPTCVCHPCICEAETTDSTCISKASLDCIVSSKPDWTM